MGRILAVTVAATARLLVAAGPALACGGLVGPNGAVNLLKTTTLAGYVDGVEHYVTSFEFAGGGGEFGSIVPLPGVPSKVQKGGRWTLQRLVQEVQPPVEVARLSLNGAADAAAGSAQVLLETRIDALDITVLKGGGDQVGQWARENGFNLSPDAPEVLDFYARRSPIFLAARFDAEEARERGIQRGDGTPVHVTIPTPNPWVPLRILALGKQPNERIEAEVFLLTDGVPAMLPEPVQGTGEGVVLERNEPASEALLADLRSDRGMSWIPPSDMWLTYLKIDTPAKALTHDLAIDTTGLRNPSPVAAGLQLPLPMGDRPISPWVWIAATVLGIAILYWVGRVVTVPNDGL